MSKRAIPAGAVVRGTDKGYVHGDLKPGNERPVEKIEKTYPYMRPRDAATLILVRMKGKTPEVLMGCRAAAQLRTCRAAELRHAAAPEDLDGVARNPVRLIAHPHPCVVRHPRRSSSSAS